MCIQNEMAGQVVIIGFPVEMTEGDFSRTVGARCGMRDASASPHFRRKLTVAGDDFVLDHCSQSAG